MYNTNQRNVNRQNPPAKEDEPHNPNPFDFVPFRDSPITQKEAEFDGMGEMMSGYFDIQIKALTAMHVVGAQKNFNDARDSKHYRQNGLPCIPAATIRGCLRAFIEALTAGWVSQATPEYEKVDGHKVSNGRHLGYSTFGTMLNQGPAVKPEYQPQVKPGYELDVASYLFGLVIEKENAAQAAHEDLARKSRVWIEDAYFQENQLDFDHYWAPDIPGDAFMGGAKPSASSWWYMKPKVVLKRPVKSGTVEMAEFVGEKYRGRKFYFHQKPEICTAYYNPDTHIWNYPDGFREIGLEVFRPDEVTDTFRIYVNRVPRQLLVLLVLSLFPGSHIRHKLGYGKAYGYGSFEFILQGAHLRSELPEQRIPPPLTDALQQTRSWQAWAWDEARLKEAGIAALIDWQALNQLALILSWEHLDSLIFTYPPFTPGYFKLGIRYDDFNNTLNHLRMTSPKGADIANSLYPQKRTIDFRLYQEKATGWDRIKQRKP